MRMKSSVLFFALLILAGQSIAAFEELEIGLTSQAMGGTGVVLFGADMALFNPAAQNRPVVESGEWEENF